MFTFPEPSVAGLSPPILGFHDVDFNYPGGPTLFKALNFGLVSATATAPHHTPLHCMGTAWLILACLLHTPLHLSAAATNLTSVWKSREKKRGCMVGPCNVRCGEDGGLQETSNQTFKP